MIDLHCHILPGVDDGAKNMEESIAMARNAVAEGITHIVATPHHMSYSWVNEKETVVKLVKQLQAELDAENIPLTIFPGQEVRIYGELLEDINQGKIQFIDEYNQYLLIEFPSTSIPTFTEQLFFQLQQAGITPIIVHPERNHAVLKDPNSLRPFIERGALSQITAGSYVGGFGKEIEKVSKQLIEANLTHFIASDSHNVTNRKFHMREAYGKLAAEYGNDKLNQFQQITKDLVNGNPVFPPVPQEIQKKRFFGLF